MASGKNPDGSQGTALRRSTLRNLKSLRASDGAADAILEEIRKAPCGKKRRHRNRTLYEEILALEGITEKEIRAMCWILAGIKEKKESVNELKTLKEEKGQIKKSIRARLRRSDSLPDNLSLLDARKVGIQIAEAVIASTQYDQARESYSEALRAVGIPAEHTNIQKWDLDLATLCLCIMFHQLTGSYQYGIAGQMLFRAGLEDDEGIREDVYSKLRNRVKHRMRKLTEGLHT